MANNVIQFGLKINADTSDARAELDRLKQVLGQLGTGSQFKLNAKQEIREASVAAQQLQKHLAAATSKTGDFDINRFTASIKKGEMSLSQMSMKLMQLGTEGTNAFRTLSTQILNAQKPALSFSNILTKMGTTLANNIRWQLSSAAINAFTGGVREAWDYTKNMDKALTNIRVVTGKSREEMDKLAAASNRMAKELRSTTEEMVKGQLIFYQQGDNAVLAAEKARITAMAANVSFESSQEEMADYLTAIWNSYQVGENQLELFVDKLSAVGASTATSMEEIATGMTKVASAANAVGVTYDQLNATIATISSTTRVSAESVGTAMKTIYARMGDLKVGKADEDGITYGQVSKQMKQMGIDIADANGQLRDMGEVVEEIGNKWKTFSKEEQQALVQAVAGKRQYTNLTALFENWDMYLNTLETSKNAMGTLQEQQDAWANSIEGASNRVASSLEGLYSRILNDDVIINMTNGLASFLEYFTGLIDALGGLETILPAITGLMVSTFAPAIVSGLTSGMMNLRTLFGGWMVDLQKSRDGLIQMANAPGFDRLSAEQQKLILNTRDLAIAQNEYVNNSRHMTAQQKQEAQFAMDTAQALQQNVLQLEELVVGYREAALESKNFQLVGGSDPNKLSGKALTNSFNKAGKNVASSMDFSPALKQQFDDIQQKIQSGVTPSVNELRNAIVAYNAEASQISENGAKEYDELIAKVGALQNQIESLNVIKSKTTQGANGLIFDPKDAVASKQIEQALKDLGVDATKIKQILKDGVIPDGTLIKDGQDVRTLLGETGKLERTLKNVATTGAKTFGTTRKKILDSSTAQRNLNKDTLAYKAALEKAKGAAKSFGTGLTTAIGGITSLTFSLSSLKSAGDAIASGDWLTGISSGLMGLTMAGSGIKSIADGIISMHGKGGEAIKGLARSMNDMGLTFQKTGSLVTDSAMSAATAWASVLGPILAVAAALAALGAVIYLVAKDMKQAETDAKSAAEQAKTFSNELDSANQELTDLKSNFENYNTKQSALDKMTEGTEEFKKALQEANEEVVDLITKYPELAEYVNDVNGRLKITTEGQKKLLEAQQVEVDRAYANKLSSNIVAIESRQEASEQRLAGKVLGDRASATGEAVGGGLSGAAIGAAIGTAIAPGLGTAIGAALGAAAGTAGGYFGFGADDRENKEHGLDKFTHAIETQGTNILSSYESLERALGGDSELAKALWESKEETNKLAREIVANKKQIDLNTKQLIIANNPEVKDSEYSSDITNIGKDIVQNEGRMNKYEQEMTELLKGDEQKAAEAYLKAMYGDEASKYRIIDLAGTNSTLQKMNDDGVWETQGTKSGLSDDTMKANYAAKMASDLTDAEIKAIEKTSQGLKERIQNYTEGNGDEIVKKIIDEYGGTPEKALKYIEEQGAGYYTIFTKHLSEDIDKAFSGSHNRVKAEEEALKFALGNNPAFEGLEEAFKNNDDGALKSYLADFQEMGLLTEHNLETFKLFKNEIMDGNLASGINVLTNKYWSQDFVDLTGTNLKTGTKQQLNKYNQIENVKISNSELQSQTEALLANSGLTEYQISQVVLDVLKAGKFTEEIENEVNRMIANTKSFAESSISDISIQHLNFDTTKEYFDTLEDGQKEWQAYIDAVNAMNDADFSRIKIEKDKIQFLKKDGSIIKEISKDTMAFNAVLRDGLAPLDAFNNKLKKDAYDALVKYNKEIGRTDEETNKFLDAIDNFDTKTIDELSKNLSEGNFKSFKLEDGVLTFYDEQEKKIQEVAGELEDLEALAKSIDPNIKINFEFNIENVLAGLREDKAKIEAEISSWNLDFSKPIALTSEQSATIDNFLPDVDWSDFKRKLENGYYKTMDEFMADIKAKKLESIAIGFDIDTTALNPQVLYDYAEALGVPKEKADELKVAFQQLADNGIAYATKDELGTIHYFNSLGEEILGLGSDAVSATADLIALGNSGLKPLSSYPGLPKSVYDSIINAGKAAGWTEPEINKVTSSLYNLGSTNIDLSQVVFELGRAKTAATDYLKAVVTAANAQFHATYDFDAKHFAETGDYGASQKMQLKIKYGTKYLTPDEFMKAVGLDFSSDQSWTTGYVPYQQNPTFPDTNKNGIDDRLENGGIDPGTTDPGSGDPYKAPYETEPSDVIKKLREKYKIDDFKESAARTEERIANFEELEEFDDISQQYGILSTKVDGYLTGLDEFKDGLINELKYVTESADGWDPTNKWDEESWFDENLEPTEEYKKLHYEASDDDKKQIEGQYERVLAIKKEIKDVDEESATWKKEQSNYHDKEIDNYIAYHKQQIKGEKDIRKQYEHTRKAINKINKELKQNDGLSDKRRAELEAEAESIADTYSSNLNAEIDNLQSFYGKMKDIQKEYAEAQAISVDNYQYLMNLSPEYIAFLMNEQGQLQLNEAAIMGATQSYMQYLAAKQLDQMIDLATKTNGEASALEGVRVAALGAADGLMAYAAAKIAAIEAEENGKEISQEDKDFIMNWAKNQDQVIIPAAISGMSRGGMVGAPQAPQGPPEREEEEEKEGDGGGEDPAEAAKKAREEARRLLKKRYEAGELSLEAYYDELSKVSGSEFLTAQELSDEKKEDSLFVANIQKDDLQKQFEDGLIDYTNYRKKMREIMSRTYYDSELGHEISIFSKEELEEMEESLGSEALSTYFDSLNFKMENNLLDAQDGVNTMRDLLKQYGSELTNEEYKELQEKVAEGISTYFDSLTFKVENELISVQQGISEMQRFLVANSDLLTQEEYIELREQIVDSIHNYADGLVEDVENEFLSPLEGIDNIWDLIINNKDFLSTEELEALFENIESIIEKGTENIVTLLSNGITNMKKATLDFVSLLESGWKIKITEENWGSLGDTIIETIERQEIVTEGFKNIIDTVTEKWEKSLISFEKGLEEILALVETYSYAFSDAEKAMYTNSEKQLEKYVSAQTKLYKDGGQTLGETISNIKENMEVDPDLVENNVFSLVNSEIDEIFKKLQNKDFSKVTEAIEEIVNMLASTPLESAEWADILDKNLGKFYEHNLTSIEEKYKNILAQQEVADWGLVDELGNETPYKLDLWEQEFAELNALKDSYIATYTGPDLINDSTYQKILARQKALQAEGQKLASEDLNFRKNWITRQKDLGNLTIDEEIAGYGRIQNLLDSDAYKEYFENEQDYYEFSRAAALDNYKAIEKAHQDKVNAIAEQLKEEYNDVKSHLENVKSLNETEFNAKMQLRESQHEINLELQKSLTMYEYLDEETRKLIFNEEDYVALSDEILRIQDEINGLTDTYNKKIESATVEQAKLLTKEYTAQVELKMQEFETAKANLEVTKKQMALQNTLNERNTRMFINGQWTWVANQESVAKAREELTQAQYKAETAQLNQDHKNSMNDLDNQIREFDSKILEIDDAVEKFKDALDGEDGLIVNIGSLNSAISDAIKHHEKGGDIDQESGEWHTPREAQDIVSETILKKFNSMRTLNDKEQRKDKVFVVGDDTYKYEVIDRYGTYGWTKNGENLGNTNWYRVLTDTIMPAYRNLDDKTLRESYIATVEANKTEKEKEEEEKVEEKPLYNTAFESNMITKTDNIISILSKMLVVDEATKNLFLDELKEVDVAGEKFELGQYSFVLQEDEEGNETFLGSDGKTYSRENIIALIESLYKYSYSRGGGTFSLADKPVAPAETPPENPDEAAAPEEESQPEVKKIDWSGYISDRAVNPNSIDYFATGVDEYGNLIYDEEKVVTKKELAGIMNEAFGGELNTASAEKFIDYFLQSYIEKTGDIHGADLYMARLAEDFKNYRLNGTFDPKTMNMTEEAYKIMADSHFVPQEVLMYQYIRDLENEKDIFLVPTGVSSDRFSKTIEHNAIIGELVPAEYAPWKLTAHGDVYNGERTITWGEDLAYYYTQIMEQNRREGKHPLDGIVFGQTNKTIRDAVGGTNSSITSNDGLFIGGPQGTGTQRDTDVPLNEVVDHPEKYDSVNAEGLPVGHWDDPNEKLDKARFGSNWDTLSGMREEIEAFYKAHPELKPVIDLSAVRKEGKETVELHIGPFTPITGEVAAQKLEQEKAGQRAVEEAVFGGAFYLEDVTITEKEEKEEPSEVEYMSKQEVIDLLMPYKHVEQLSVSNVLSYRYGNGILDVDRKDWSGASLSEVVQDLYLVNLKIIKQIDEAYGGQEYSAEFWSKFLQEWNNLGFSDKQDKNVLLDLMAKLFKDGPLNFYKTIFAKPTEDGIYQIPKELMDIITDENGEINEELLQSKEAKETFALRLGSDHWDNKIGYTNVSEETFFKIMDSVLSDEAKKTVEEAGETFDFATVTTEGNELKTEDQTLVNTVNEDGSLNTFDETADAAIVDADSHNTQTMLDASSSIVDAIEGIEIKVTNNYYEDNGNPEFNAHGNIIDRPTLSWVGEDGPEAIIPLSQKYRARGLSLWEEATRALGIAPSFTMPTIRASFPQQKENMNVSQMINVTVQNEDSSNDFYAITNLL